MERRYKILHLATVKLQKTKCLEGKGEKEKCIPSHAVMQPLSAALRIVDMWITSVCEYTAGARRVSLSVSQAHWTYRCEELGSGRGERER